VIYQSSGGSTRLPDHAWLPEIIRRNDLITQSHPARFSTSITFESFGVRIGITLDDASIREGVIEALPPGWTPIRSADLHRRYDIVDDGLGNGDITITIDGVPGGTFPNQDRLLDFLEGDIQLHVAEFASPHLFVHAGVVGWRGKAILLPGTSFAGKSTLVTSLVQAGATYYSDEYAVLDDAGRVLPYPRRVSLRPGPHGPSGRLDLREHTPQGPGASVPIPVGLVALLTYDAAARWQVEPLSRIEGILAMSEQTVAIQRRPGDTFSTLRRVVKDATLIKGTRGEVDEAVRVLLSMDEVRVW
jgi:hypothetical protein